MVTRGPSCSQIRPAEKRQMRACSISRQWAARGNGSRLQRKPPLAWRTSGRPGTRSYTGAITNGPWCRRSRNDAEVAGSAPSRPPDGTDPEPRCSKRRGSYGRFAARPRTGAGARARHRPCGKERPRLTAAVSRLSPPPEDQGHQGVAEEIGHPLDKRWSSHVGQDRTARPAQQRPRLVVGAGARVVGIAKLCRDKAALSASPDIRTSGVFAAAERDADRGRMTRRSCRRERRHFRSSASQYTVRDPRADRPVRRPRLSGLCNSKSAGWMRIALVHQQFEPPPKPML